MYIPPLHSHSPKQSKAFLLFEMNSEDPVIYKQKTKQNQCYIKEYNILFQFITR